MATESSSFGDFHCSLSEQFNTNELQYHLVRTLPDENSKVTFGELTTETEKFAALPPEKSRDIDFGKIARHAIAQIRGGAFILFKYDRNPEGYTLAPDPNTLEEPDQVIQWIRDEARLRELLLEHLTDTATAEAED